jgi:hypothetical protein
MAVFCASQKFVLPISDEGILTQTSSVHSSKAVFKDMIARHADIIAIDRPHLCIRLFDAGAGEDGEQRILQDTIR